MKTKTKKTSVKINRCKICKTKIKEAGNCVLCNKSLAVVNEMLIINLGVEAGKHELYELYFGTIYKALEEKRITLKKITGDTISFLSLAILESAESKNGNRKLGDYLEHMEYEKVVAVHFYDEHKRLPTKDELSLLVDELNKKIDEDSDE